MPLIPAHLHLSGQRPLRRAGAESHSRHLPAAIIFPLKIRKNDVVPAIRLDSCSGHKYQEQPTEQCLHKSPSYVLTWRRLSRSSNTAPRITSPSTTFWV